MAKILSVTTSRVRDGKQADYLAAMAKLKAFVEGNGATMRVLQQTYGGNPLTITTVIECPDWAAFGAFSAKLEKDSGVQALLAQLRANPVSDIIARGVSTEVDV
ncbi:MAG TPA: hypothetical protein VN806_13620 [Caulobacteraceae bacterium]|jgi:hypothetical protein|nr:hypothetical protein [Caulobacteraceae bacterium]